MARLPKGGASAPSTVLPFPQTKRALRHYRTGMDAAGFLSLLLLERSGEPVPANVQRYDEPEGAAIPSKSPELLLALCVWSELPTKKKEIVKDTVRGLAYAPNASASAVQLHNLLSRRA